MNIPNILKKFLSLEILSNNTINLKPQYSYLGTRTKKQLVLNYKLKIFQIFEVHKLIKDIVNFRGNFIFMDSQPKIQQIINQVLQKYKYFPNFEKGENFFITKHLEMYPYNLNKFQNVLIFLNTQDNQLCIEKALLSKIPIICIIDQFSPSSSFYKFAGNSNSLRSLYSNILLFVNLITFYKKYNNFLLKNYFNLYSAINKQKSILWVSAINSKSVNSNFKK